MEKLVAVGPHLLKLPEWQVTISDLMHAERDCLVRKLSLDERSASASVERRDREFLVSVS